MRDRFKLSSFVEVMTHFEMSSQDPDAWFPFDNQYMTRVSYKSHDQNIIRDL